MKTLLIMRHAKSSPAQASEDDVDRQLNDRGIRDATGMGRLLAKQGLKADAIITSSAERAQRTAELMATTLEFPGTIETTETLYLAEPPKYIQRLALQDDAVGTVLVVGHNPGVEGLITKLSGESVPMPTAAIARIDLGIGHWSKLGKNTKGTLNGVWCPGETRPDS